MEHFLLRHFVLEYYYLVQLDCKMKIERLNWLGIFNITYPVCPCPTAVSADRQAGGPARRQAGTRQGGRYLER